MSDERSSTKPSPFTKRELLSRLRSIQRTLHGSRAVAQVKRLSDRERRDFVASRLLLDRVIIDLDRAVMKEIRTELEMQTKRLHAGLRAIEESIRSLEDAVKWAKMVNQLLGALTKAVPLL